MAPENRQESVLAVFRRRSTPFTSPPIQLEAKRHDGDRGGRRHPAGILRSGSHHDYTPAELKARFHNHSSYVREVDKTAKEVLKAGFILPYDAAQVEKSAAASETSETGK